MKLGLLFQILSYKNALYLEKHLLEAQKKELH